MKAILSVVFALSLIFFTASITYTMTYNDLIGDSLSMQRLIEVRDVVDKYSIYDYEEEELADILAASMIMATGDPWGAYIAPSYEQIFNEQQNNAYVGIGITIEETDDASGLEVVSVSNDSPAQTSGILPGDVLIAVEDALVADIGQNETVNRVRGEEGSTVNLTFTREDEPFEVEILRAAIEQKVAELMMLDDDIALIDIYNFEGMAAEQTLEAIETAVEEDASAIIFDLRGNPGGYQHEMVAILDRLLPEGVLFRSVDFAGNEEIDHSDEIYLDLPMAVIVDENSYSAAEFFAAAMQEYDAAVIVGVQTTGKGDYQNSLPISHGGILHISTGRYFTPNGLSLTDTGVVPDVTVALDEETMAQYYMGTLSTQDDAQLQAAVTAVQK